MKLKLYKTQRGPLLEGQGRILDLSDLHWDALFTMTDPVAYLRERYEKDRSGSSAPIDEATILPPILGQEVWAAGVTYIRSREARMEESQGSGGSDFYDRVYVAERPELFFKSTLSRTVGHREDIGIRRDSNWNVPEPELTVAATKQGTILGYTVGNDVSSRDIEGENPLYLPQAKVYSRSCALGPCVLLSDKPLPPSTQITMHIKRDGKEIMNGTTDLSRLKRSVASLVAYLYRSNVFPLGCYLMTGTGVVPPSGFTLQGGDEVRIAIDGIGTLVNRVVVV